jgi:hypothetical protein
VPAAVGVGAAVGAAACVMLATPLAFTTVIRCSVLGFDSYFHRKTYECPAVSYGRGCQGTPFLWFLCTFHLWLL